MGFQDMPEVVHQAASRKGGKARVRKGWASRTAAERKKIAAKGGKTKYENRSKKAGKNEERTSVGRETIMDAILGDVDDIHN